MANTFSLILVIVTLVTGIVWALEKLVLAKKRQEKLGAIEGQTTDGLDASLQAKIAAQPWWIENCVSIFPVIAFVLVLRSFIYEPFQIPSGSMMPTLLIGDFIVVEKYAYGIKDPVWRTQLVETGKPERGDTVVFKYPLNPNIDYIKRVVGLPGDVVRYSKDKQLCVKRIGELSCKVIKQSNVQKSIHANGSNRNVYQMDEMLGEEGHQILVNRDVIDNYARYKKSRVLGEWVVPQGQYFVMGDNRDNSADSRFWGFVPEGNLVGKAVAIWISFEFERGSDSILPSWIPTGVRFSRVGGIH